MKKGIDLSTHNKVTDWGLVRDNVDFVILRAGYGNNNIDEKFVPYAQACMGQNIPMGLFWFSYAYTPDMARREALFCIAQARKYKITYPIAFDFEYDSVEYAQKKGVNVTKHLVMDMTVAFCEEIRAAGYIPAVYTNKDYSKQYFDLTELKSRGYDIWYAYYNKTSDRDDIALWQYTSIGRVPGISGNVDIDISYVDYVEKPGWVQDGAFWKYRKENGELCKSCWWEADGMWYHFDADGVMQTGWLQDDDEWYFLKNNGIMAHKEMLVIQSPEHGDEMFIFAEDGHMIKTNERGAVV